MLLDALRVSRRASRFSKQSCQDFSRLFLFPKSFFSIRKFKPWVHCDFKRLFLYLRQHDLTVLSRNKQRILKRVEYPENFIFEKKYNDWSNILGTCSISMCLIYKWGQFWKNEKIEWFYSYFIGRRKLQLLPVTLEMSKYANTMPCSYGHSKIWAIFIYNLSSEVKTQVFWPIERKIIPVDGACRTGTRRPLMRPGNELGISRSRDRTSLVWENGVQVE